MSDIKFLEEWYSAQCDGDWEHGESLRIYTLDNPGWALDANLSKTIAAAAQFSPFEMEVDELNWCRCWIERSVFHGRGGSENLSDMLKVFRTWVSQMS